MATTLLQLEKLLSAAIGDDLEFDTDTDLTSAATVVVISTTLANYDGGQDDAFNDWWLHIISGSTAGSSNVGKLRQVSDYLSSATYQLTVRGSAWTTNESSAVTCRLHKYNRNDKVWAIRRALEELSPTLHEKIDDMTLVTGNILPTGHFEWNPTTASVKFLLGAGSSVTFAPTTGAGDVRGPLGTKSIKVTATTNSCWAEYDSNTYPRLLDLQGRSVSFYCQVKPEVVDDAWIQLYTLKADGTSQNLPSTWGSTDECYADYWNQMDLEGQALSTGLQRVKVRFRVDTKTKYAYFDDAIVCGKYLHDYMLPEDFQSGKRGHLSQVYVQTKGYSKPICYDLQPIYWDRQEFRVDDDGTYKWLHLKDLNTNYRRIRLIGYKPIEFSSTADSGTIDLEGEQLNLVVARAAQLLYRRVGQPVSAEDVDRYKRNIAEWEREERKLKPTLMMGVPSDTLWLGR